MKEQTFSDIDSYLALQTTEVRLCLQHIRETIKSVVPDAEELISYQMPAFKYHGMLVYFAAFKNHCSFFAGNGSLIQSMADDLKDFKTSKATLQFTVENPLPDALVIKIVEARVKENLLKLENKKTKK